MNSARRHRPEALVLTLRRPGSSWDHGHSPSALAPAAPGFAPFADGNPSPPNSKVSSAPGINPGPGVAPPPPRSDGAASGPGWTVGTDWPPGAGCEPRTGQPAEALAALPCWLGTSGSCCGTTGPGGGKASATSAAFGPPRLDTPPRRFWSAASDRRFGPFLLAKEETSKAALTRRTPNSALASPGASPSRPGKGRAHLHYGPDLYCAALRGAGGRGRGGPRASEPDRAPVLPEWVVVLAFSLVAGLFGLGFLDLILHLPMG